MKRLPHGPSGYAGLALLAALFAATGCGGSGGASTASSSAGNHGDGGGGTVSGPGGASTGDVGATTGAGGAAGSVGATTGAGGTLPMTDVQIAQAFIEPLVLGVNIERGWAWSMPGVNPASSTEYWSYLKNTVGVTHVRLFYPWRPSVTMGGGGPDNSPPDQNGFNRILDASQQAIKAGLKVFLDCTDVMGVEDFTGSNGDATETHIANCADWTAQRNLDPTMFALGPVNEWAGGDDNTTYNAYRKHFHGVLRAKLPGYVLTTGPGYWKSRDWIYDAGKKFETFDDLKVIYEWHEYSSLDANGWKDEEGKLAAWRAANGGRPTICGEAGPGWPDEQVNGQPLGDTPSAWPDRFLGMLPSVAADRPSIWTVTYGNGLRINFSGDDPHIMDGSNGTTNFVQMFHDAEASMKTALGK